jgi:hypothetical protein
VTGRFEDFDARIQRLDAEQSLRIRKRFIDEFIDQDAPGFDESIRRLVAFTDGMAQTGYLWDFIKARTLIDEADLWDRVNRRDWVYVMWDIHSSDRILIEDYWRYPKDSVLISRPPGTVQAGQSFLPEDLYLFDDSFAWVAATTHDEIDGRRFCLWAGAPYLT